MNGDQSTTRACVLVVDPEPRPRKALTIALRTDGYDVVEAAGLDEGLAAVELPDAVVTTLTSAQALDRLSHLCGAHTPRPGSVPLIVLAPDDHPRTRREALDLGASEVLPHPVDVDLVVARVGAHLRVPVPEGAQGVHSSARFRSAIRTVQADRRRARPGVVALLDIHEADAVDARFGHAALVALRGQIRDFLGQQLHHVDVTAPAGTGTLILMPEASPREAAALLRTLGQALARADLRVGGERVHVTAVSGYAGLEDDVTPLEMVQRAVDAAEANRRMLDLEPRGWTPSPPEEHASRSGSSWWARYTTPLEIIGVHALVLGLPLVAYLLLDRYVVNVVPFVYLVVVAALLITAGLIWVESLYALEERDPPEVEGEYPPAAAIIAAYLPNEAATIEETLHAFLRLDYPGELEIILAYNTPDPLPVEATLRQLEAEHPRLRVISVPDSRSKAKNVNYALGQTQAAMIGIFDADHQPEPGSFKRAWAWLASGYDIVQGHCLVRNGDESFVARTIAVEFELIYAVSHPGRARMHGFGVFGGSNGFWRGDLLRSIRMQGFMLTEDIDSSIRAVSTGHRIANDPLLISRELAPTTWTALWNQRMRWAQGWFEVSLRHSIKSLFSPQLTVRNKLGMAQLMIWRELYPWISLQMFPVLAFMVIKAGGPGEVDYLVPIFVLTSLVTLMTGPFQAAIAYFVAHPDIRRHRGWFLTFTVTSVFYTTFKNVIGMVAQLRHFRGDNEWKVTPRTGGEA